MRYVCSIVIYACAIMMVACKSNNTEEIQQLELENQLIGITTAHNARQLGGYIIGDKKIKDDLLIRSAKLSGLSKEDSTLLSDKYNVQCIYDFRSQEEFVSEPDIIPGNARCVSLSISFAAKEEKSQFGAEYQNQQEMIGLLLQYAEHPAIQTMCENMYEIILFEEESQEVYRNFFQDLVTLEPENGAVLWHCTQGKDRAGCASAMLLAALGADRNLIMADFILSKDYYEPMVSRIKTETEQQRNVINTLISANPEIFEAALDRIDSEYVSFRNYLTECIGVTPAMMQVLRNRYLE
ncbi:MAG: tyrosine-protein phosphatase [Bacteroidaceae bacterium]|nr:tyrosine-protein phosphatase [Bacteroidaceae bacterium]